MLASTQSTNTKNIMNTEPLQQYKSVALVMISPSNAILHAAIAPVTLFKTVSGYQVRTPNPPSFYRAQATYIDDTHIYLYCFADNDIQATISLYGIR